jgi:perosamine synthetase
MKLIVSNPHDDWAKFPKSNIPILPIMDVPFFFNYFSDHSKNSSAFFHKMAIYAPGGRYALSMASDIMGLNSRDSILMPSYHCLSMIAPAAWSGADIRFYKLNENLSFDIEDIKKKISPSTKAILAVHFSGFPQKLSKLKELCKKYKINLIEDCAHAFFGYNGSEKIGSAGDFAIASLKKFFPVTDGGVLITNRPADCQFKQISLKLKDQLKHIVNLFEESTHYQKIKPINTIFNIINGLKSSENEKQTVSSENEVSDAPKITSWLNPALSTRKISKISKFIIKHANADQICTRRRENFLYLLENLNHLKTVKPLYSALPQGVVPYMFPLV